MTEQEKIDSDILKAKVNELKINCFEYMIQQSRFDANMLKCCGHKTIQDAVMYSLNSTKQQIDKLFKEYFKKYPD